MRLKGYFLSIALMGLGSAAIAQQEPEHWLEFNGVDQYVVIPSHTDFDLGTDDDLTITGSTEKRAAIRRSPLYGRRRPADHGL